MFRLRLFFRKVLPLFVLVFAFWNCSEDNPMPNQPVDPEPTYIPDVFPYVSYISLYPSIKVPTSVNSSESEGWPDLGQEIKWQAHIFNNDTSLIPGVRYEWIIDGQLIEQGKMDLLRGETIVEFSWFWAQETKKIDFKLEVQAHGDSLYQDEISVYSKALSVGLWIEQTVYNEMKSKSNVPEFELWARNEVENWNDILIGKEAVETGIVDRLRLDRLAVLPDGSPHPGNIENSGVLETDLVWYFSADFPDTRFLTSPVNFVWRDQTIVLHELLHQRGLIDIYAYEVVTDYDSEILILDPDGRKAVGSVRMRYVHPGSVFVPDFDFVLMGQDYYSPTIVSEHSSYGLNLFAQYRTPKEIDQWGNRVNLLHDNNPYVSHVPNKIKLKLVNMDGSPLKNVMLDVFLDHGEYDYQDYYLEEPDFTLEVNTDGITEFTSEIWNNESWIKRVKANVIILRARSIDNSIWGYAFLPSYDLNVAYYQGETESAEFEVSFTLR